MQHPDFIQYLQASLVYLQHLEHKDCNQYLCSVYLALYFYPLLGIARFLVLFYDLECRILEL